MRIFLSAFVATAFWVSPARADVVSDWNNLAIDTMVQAKWPTIRQQRAITMMEIAVFEALNSIRPTYHPYVFAGKADSKASLEAAASQAAYRVLATLDPSIAAPLAVLNEKVLAGISDTDAREAGVAVGDATAQAIVAERQSDGFNGSTAYAPGAQGPGIYQPTSDGSMIAPHFAAMRPFALKLSSQLRLPPPPPLTSEQFLRDLAEVRERGGAEQPHTPEEAEIAKFHVPAGLYSWNEIARQALAVRAPDPLQSARTLALLNIALSDAFSAGYDSKYFYNFWRPVTTIRAGGNGFGHPEIAGDLAWNSLLGIPLHPEYPCMHCVVGAAAQNVLEAVTHNSAGFAVTQGKVTRRFASFRAYAEEEAESRILGGVHYRWSLIAGAALGRQVGQAALKLLSPL